MTIQRILFGCLVALLLSGCASVRTVDSEADVTHHFSFDKSLKRGKAPWPRETTSPYVVSNYIFQSSRYGFLVAMDKNSKELWRFNVSQGVEGKPLFVNGRLYFGANNGYFYCLLARTGKVLWKYKTDSSVISQATYRNGVVYFLSLGDFLYALNAKSGKWIWHYKRDLRKDSVTVRGTSSPVYYGGRIFAGFSDGFLVSLNASRGSVVWSKKISRGGRFRDLDATPYVGKSRILVLGYEGELYSLNRKTGSVMWKVPTHGGIDFTVGSTYIYVSTTHNEVKAFSGEKGKVVWTWKLDDDGSITGPVVLGSSVLVGDSESSLHVLNAKTGKEKWRFSTRYGISAKPFIYRGDIYLYSNASKLIALKKTKR